MNGQAYITHSAAPARAGRCALALALALGALAACGGGLSAARAADLRQRLRAAMTREVSTREQRDDNSRTLAEVVGEGALERLDQPDLRALLGSPQPCREPICAEHGFVADDWYYEVGIKQGDQVKQLPVLIIGFDPRGRPTRFWTLTTH